MSGRLAGKRAVITAAAQGIGRASAELFVREGAQVIATDVNGDALATLSGASAAARRHRHRRPSPPSPRRPDPSTSCSTAPASSTAAPSSSARSTDWDRAFEVNVTAMFQMIRAFLPGMLERGRGSIINMSSVASSVTGVPNRFAYGASKAAVIGLTKSIAVDFVARASAATRSARARSTRLRCRAASARRRRHSGAAEADVRAQFEKRQPMGRLGRPEEIAALALYLASDESAFTTGTVSVVDGGWTI